MGYLSVSLGIYSVRAEVFLTTYTLNGQLAQFKWPDWTSVVAQLDLSGSTAFSFGPLGSNHT